MKQYFKYLAVLFCILQLHYWQAVVCAYESKNALPLISAQPTTVPSQKKQDKLNSNQKRILRPKITVGFIMSCDQKFQPLMRTMETMSKQFRGVTGRHFQTQQEFEKYTSKKLRLNPSEIILTLDIASHSVFVLCQEINR